MIFVRQGRFANTDTHTRAERMISSVMESSTEPIAAPPADLPPELRGPPPPPHGGLPTLLRFMRRNRMLNLKYGVLLLRLGAWKLRLRGRLRLDGIAFIGPGCRLEVGPKAVLELGRWSWLGHGCKIRCHEGQVQLGAKSVMGQECTISAYQSVSIGRECVIADRVMLIDFDHGTVEVERPIRLQGIYKRDVRVGHNVWIGYGACILRGVSVGDNCIVGTNTVVTKDVASNAVVAGAPARVLRMRKAPATLRWS
jgi:acetyltransferase-like isoleucine patch superfamily enzyme